LKPNCRQNGTNKNRPKIYLINPDWLAGRDVPKDLTEAVIAQNNKPVITIKRIPFRVLN
jgi:hypothetical protein|tara:strand:- start:261 stop:437 length:177 start_codon:yes stop_codon:yes gene_type:complete